MSIRLLILIAFVLVAGRSFAESEAHFSELLEGEYNLAQVGGIDINTQSRESTQDRIKKAKKSKNKAVEEFRWQELPPDTLNTKIGFQTPSLNLSFERTDVTDIEPLSLIPASRSNTFISGAYSYFGLSVGAANPVRDEDRIMYGKTSFSDFQFRIFGPKRTYELHFQQYKGYYVENSELVDASIQPEDPRIQLPDLATRHYGMNIIQSFQPERYNLAVGYDQAGYQIATGASWLGTFSINHHSISNPSAIVPSSLSSTFYDLSDVVGGSFTTFSVGGGYGGGWKLWEDYYLGLVGLVSFGSQKQVIKKLGGTHEHWTGNSKASVRLTLGYNVEKYFVGFQSIVDSTNFPINEGRISMSSLDASIFLG